MIETNKQASSKEMAREFESSCGWLTVWGSWAEHRNKIQRELKNQQSERKEFDYYELKVCGLV